MKEAVKTDTDGTSSARDWVKQKGEEDPGKDVASLLSSHTLPEHPKTAAAFPRSMKVEHLNIRTQQEGLLWEDKQCL